MKMKNKEPFIEREFCFFYGIVFLAFSAGLFLGGSVNAISNNRYLFMGLGFLGLLLNVLEKQRSLCLWLWRRNNLGGKK